MKEYIFLLLCAAVAVCTAHNFENCEPLPDPTATHPWTKEILPAGSLTVYPDGDEVVADVNCDETRGFFLFPLHSERLRCSYDAITEVWKWEHVAKGQQVPAIECIYVYPGAEEHVLDFGAEYEGCSTPEEARETIEKVQETLEGSLPCSLNNECVVRRLDCRKTESTTLLTFQVMSRALLDMAEQRVLVETAVDFIESFYHPVFNGNKIRRSKRSSTTQCDDGHGGVTFETSETACAVCPTGTYESSNACVPCDYGYYSNEAGVTACTACSLKRHEYSTLAKGSKSEDQCVAVCQAPSEAETNFANDYANVKNFRPLRVIQHDTMVMTCKPGYYYGGERTATITCDHLKEAYALPKSCRSITLEVSDDVLEADETSQQITCTVYGPDSSPTSIEWMLNGADIQNIGSATSDYSYSGGDNVVDEGGSRYTSTLVIANARGDDKIGLYSCRANINDERSEDSETISYEISDGVLISIDKDSNLEYIHTGLQGEEIKVTCTLPELNAYSQREIKWQKDYDGSFLSYTEGIHNSITDDNTYQSVLTIDAATSSDAGSYKCIGIYRKDQDHTINYGSEKTFQIRLAFFQQDSSLPRDLYTLNDNIPELNCKYEVSNAAFGFTLSPNWYKDDVLMDPQPSGTVAGSGSSTDPFSRPLTIDSTSVTNSGVYFCRVADSTDADRYMDGPSNVISIYDLGFATTGEPTNQYVEPDADATLTCTYKEPTESNIIVTVLWLDATDSDAIVNDFPVDDHSTVYYETDKLNSQSTLTSRSVQVKTALDSYKCRVIYGIGDKKLEYTSGEAEIRVRGISIEVDAAPVVYASGSDPITFTCIYQGYDYRNGALAIGVTDTDLDWESDANSAGETHSTTGVASGASSGDKLELTTEYKIESPTALHSGQIKCKLEIPDSSLNDDEKRLEKSVEYHYRKVEVAPDATALTKYSTAPSDTVACSYKGLDGDDAKRVIWTVDNVIVTNDDENVAITTGVLNSNIRTDTLTISGRTPNQDFTIKCDYLFMEPEESLFVQQDLKFEGIYQDLNAKYFADEDALVMECVFAGSADPTVEWIQDSSPVTSNSDFTIENSASIEIGTYSSKLTLVSSNDVNGVFKCKFAVGTPPREYESSTGSQVKTRSVDRSSTPDVSAGFIYQDEGATLTCSIRSADNDDTTGVTWYGPDNSVIKTELRADTIHYELALKIDDPSGDYKCSFAFAEGGPVESTFESVRLAKIRMVSPRDIIHAVKDTSEASNFIVECEADSEAELSDLKMYNGDNELSDTDAVKTFGDEKTVIKYTVPVNEELDNLYSCRKSATETSETTEVMVHQIKEELQDVYFVSVGDVLTLACDSGYRTDVDEPMVQWFYNSAPLGAAKTPNVVTLDRVSDSKEIVISESVPSGATVKCEFTYTGIEGHGTLTSEGKVVEKAIVEDPATQTVRKVGDDALFTCTLTGPNINIQWLRGDGTLFVDASINPIDTDHESSFYDYDSNTYEKKSVLKLQSLTAEDSDAEITCRAEEGLEATFSLSVIGIVTQPDSDGIQVIDEEGGSVTLTCVISVGPSRVIPENRDSIWYLDDNILNPNDAGYTVTTDSAISPLNTMETTLVVQSRTVNANGGNYKCQFQFSELSDAVISNVANVKDRILTKDTYSDVSTIWYHKTEDLTLRCLSTDADDDNPTYTWLDPDGAILSFTLERTIANDDTALSGDYTCRAVYTSPDTTVQQVFNVQMAPVLISPSAQQFVTEMEGNTATISCEVRSENEVDLKFVDEIGGSAVSNTDKKYEGGKTKIIHIFKNLAYATIPIYEYKCRIGDDDETATDAAIVNVIGWDKSSLNVPANIFLRDQDTASLDCKVKHFKAGLTAPTVQWYKGSEEINGFTPVQTNDDTNDNTYSISSSTYTVTADDNDDRISYRCVFSFTDSELVGSSSQWEFSRLLVISKIIAEESDVFLDANDAGISSKLLTCTLYGDNTVAVAWSSGVNDYPYDATDSGTYIDDDFSITSTLEVYNLGSNTYKCQKNGEAEVTATINFEKYDFSGTDASVYGETGKTIDLVCNVAGLLTDLTVTWLDGDDNVLATRNSEVSASLISDTYQITTDKVEEKTVTCKISRNDHSYSGTKDIAYKTFDIDYKKFYYIPYDSDVDGNIEIEVEAVHDPTFVVTATGNGQTDADIATVTGFAAVPGNWEENKKTLTTRFATSGGDTITVTCVITDSGSASYEFTFATIQQDITITRDPNTNDIIGPSTDTLSFTCSAAGAVEFSWRLGDTDLQDRLGTNVLGTGSSTLTFVANDPLWNNGLKCFARFEGDYQYTIDTTLNLNAYGAFMESETFMDGETEDAVMTCVVWTDLEPKSVTWTRLADNPDGDEIITDTYNSRFVIGTPETWPQESENSVGYYTLTISDMGFGDQSTYRCDVEFDDAMGVTDIPVETELKKMTAIFEHPSSYYRDNLDDFKLTCVYTGLEDATVQWFRGDTTNTNEITGDRIETGNFLYFRKTSTLAFTDPTVSDSNKYICKWNVNSDDTPTAELDLYINTVAITGVSSPVAVFVAGDTITLTCSVDSSGSDISYKWRHRDSELSGQVSSILSVGDGDTANPEEDNGEYICEVTWPGGFVMTTSVTLDIRLASIIDNDNAKLSTIFVNEDSEEMIMCKLEAGTEPISVTWNPDVDPKVSNTKALDNSIVYYSNVTKPAVTTTFETESTTCTFAFWGDSSADPAATVTLQYAKTTPESECMHFDINQGADGQLQCTYKGKEETLEVQFTLPDGTDVEGVVGSFQDDTAGYKLVTGTHGINPISVEHSGTYECGFHPTDNSFIVSSRFRVTARAAIFTPQTESGSLELVSGTTVEFTCTVEGGVKSIEWQSKDVNDATSEFTPITAYREKSRDMTESGLFIKTMVIELDVTANMDDISYKCVGTYEDEYCNSDDNTKGEFPSNEVQVTIKDDNMITDLEALTTGYAGNDLTLSCAFPNLLPDDHTYKVSWFYKKNSGDTLQEMLGLGSVYEAGDKVIDGVIDSADTNARIDSTLLIEKADTNAEGYYMCMIKWGHIFIKSRTTELQMASFTTSPLRSIALKDAFMDVQCTVQAWSSNIISSLEIKKRDAQGTTTSFSAADTGDTTHTSEYTFDVTSPGSIYYCEAEYTVAGNTVTIKSEEVEFITITPTVTPDTVWGVEGQTATLSCQATGVVLANSDGTPLKDSDGKNIPLNAVLEWYNAADNTAVTAITAITRSTNIDSNGILHASTVLTQLNIEDNNEQFYCRMSIGAPLNADNYKVLSGAVQSSLSTLKIAQITGMTFNTGTYSDVDGNTPDKPLIRGDTFTITCTVTADTVPAFTFYSENFEGLDPTYYLRTDDLSVASNGQTHTAQQVVKAITPNKLNEGEVIKCKADFGQTRGFTTKEETLITYYNCAEATFRTFYGDWIAVDRDNYFDFSPSDEKLYVSTDSTLDSSPSPEQLSVSFETASSPVISFAITFGSSPSWALSECALDAQSFDTAPPLSTSGDTTWIIYVNPAKTKLIVECNDVKVLEYTLADATNGCDAGITAADMLRAKFVSTDTASDEYRIGSVETVTQSIDTTTTEYGKYTQTVTCPDDDDTFKYALTPDAEGFAETITCQITTGEYDGQLQSCAKLVPFTSYVITDSQPDVTASATPVCSTEESRTNIISRLEGDIGSCAVDGGHIKCLEAGGGCAIKSDGIDCTWNSGTSEYTISVEVEFSSSVWKISDLTDLTSWPEANSDPRFPISDSDCSIGLRKKRSFDELEVVDYTRNRTITGEDEEVITETLHISYQWLVGGSIVGVAVVAALLITIRRSRNMQLTAKTDIESLLN